MVIVKSSIRASDLYIFFIVFSIIAGVFYLQKSFDWRGRAKGVPANIIVDMSTVGTEIDTSFYHAFAQGGEEQGNMIKPVEAQVKALHPTYIRLDHIYDAYAVVSGDPSHLSYDWSRLDDVVSSILATGAKPFLSLSYMPSNIATDGSIINVPTNWGLWEQVVEETIRHFSGVRKISGVMYEVWNEPDLGQFGGWKYYGSKNYLQLYMTAANAAERVKNVEKFFFGGPATTSYYDAWIKALLASGNRVDFVSWHTYDSNPSTIATQVKKFTELLALNPSFGVIPVYITEFGHTGDKSPLYSSVYEAVYTGAVIRQILDIPVKPAIFSFQLKNGPKQENGWGMMTHESEGVKLKPRYHVFELLDSMKGKRVALTGEGTWVTGYATINGTTLKILLMNIDPDEPGARHIETVPVTITHLASGEYTLKNQRLLEKSITSKATIASDSATLSIYMPANSMQLLEFTKNTP